ncbi:MAG: hypothetical protein CMJ65_09095 [Planctomycetaceae bacterium]|jgi:hypothetical protein|nr:hypothetical protein [Planctomycetaceae bacterium]
MLRVLGHRRTACDGFTRREAIRVGGLSLFSGISLPTLLHAASQQRDSQGTTLEGKARSVILINLFGGPPHQDTFDLKPEAPKNIRGEFSPIATATPGLHVCELLPMTAAMMDRLSLIRTYSHKYNSHNPYNVLTGFDGGSDRENYFAKRSDHPSIMSVCRHFGLGRDDVPPYVIMPAYPGFSQGLRRAGPYGGYLGSRYDPLFTVWDKKFDGKGEFYKPVPALGEPLLPSLNELPAVTANRLDRRRSLLEQFDTQLSRIDNSRAARSMSQFQQQVFSLLTSPRTRAAFDLSRESRATRSRYGNTVWANSCLVARRLVEAGSTFISVNWEEADSGNHWDLHSNNFNMCRHHLPILDQMFTALVDDLEQRGLLETTLVVLMGEMGRTPRINKNSGRDHWPQCGFVLLAGGGTKRGLVLGRTDRQAAYPVERPVSAGDMASTIYQLLGVDPTQVVHDLSGRPVHISHGGQPVWEAIA